MARMYYADGSYKDTNGYGHGRSRKATKNRSSGDTIKWVLLALLIIAACACLVAVNHNLYVGKHANARNYGNEVCYQADVVKPALSTFTAEQLVTENGLQELLNASQLAASYSYGDKGEWYVTFFEPEWLSTAPKVVISGNSSGHNALACEVKKFMTGATPVQFTFENEQYVHEITLGKHSFVLTPSQAQTLIDTIRNTFPQK